MVGTGENGLKSKQGRKDTATPPHSELRLENSRRSTMKPRLAFLLGALLPAVARSEISEDRISFVANHGSKIPLVGIGVGNLAPEFIPDVRSLPRQREQLYDDHFLML